MSELEIPGRAWNAADSKKTTWGAIKAAAPIIVAAELRRMADEAEAAGTDSMWGRRELRYRADELDPPAVNP